MQRGPQIVFPVCLNEAFKGTEPLGRWPHLQSFVSQPWFPPQRRKVLVLQYPLTVPIALAVVSLDSLQVIVGFVCLWWLLPLLLLLPSSQVVISKTP